MVYDPNREPNLYPHPYQVVVINSRSVDLELSMAYEKRWIQSYEWHYDRNKDSYSTALTTG